MNGDNWDCGSSSQIEEDPVEKLEELELEINQEMFSALHLRRRILISTIDYLNESIQQLHKKIDQDIKSCHNTLPLILETLGRNKKLFNFVSHQIHLINKGFRKRTLSSSEVYSIFSDIPI